MDKFADYIYYLLPAPFKRLKKKLNQWYIYCTVLGQWFDTVKEDLLKAADQTTVATCDNVLLQFYADDRDMTRYEWEDDDTFRRRIAMQASVDSLGGTKEGILLAVQTAGFEMGQIEFWWMPELTGDESRWAEFCLVLKDGLDSPPAVGYAELRRYVREAKESEAKDNYLFECIAMLPIGMGAEVKLHIKDEIWYFNGLYKFDGTRRFSAGREEDAVL